MSAYLCDVDHLSAVAEILSWGATFKGRTPEQIFPLVVRENVRSLQARYPASPETWEGAELMTYRPQRAEDAHYPQRLKALHCYQYQSCEHNGWMRCKVRRATDDAIRVIANEIAQRLPAYDHAVWGWRK